MLKTYLITALFFVLSQSLLAQNSDNEYQFSQLDITNGLSNNRVNVIYKDKQGFMWFGTTSGLNRFDGYKFKIFKHDESDIRSLINNYIVHIYEGPDNKMWVYTNNGISVYDPGTEKFSSDIIRELRNYNVLSNDLGSLKKDAYGRFWFLTNYDGIYIYDPLKRSTVHYSSLPSSKMPLHANHVVEMVNGVNNANWIIYSDGVIDKIDTRTNKILFRSYGLNTLNGREAEPYLATMSNDQRLWIYLQGKATGVFCYDTKTNKLDHFGKGSPAVDLDYNLISSIVQGDNDKIWIGTDHGGINVVNTKTNHVDYLLNREDNPKSLRGNTANLYKDDNGIIWAGTFKQGVSYYHKGIFQFPLIRHYLTDNTSLPYEDVDSFVEGPDGSLWIGTNGGGLVHFDRQTKKYTQYKHNANDPNSLTNDVIVYMAMDHEHKLWIGTYFGGLDCFDGKKFTHYRHSDSNPASISDDRIYSIFEDVSQRLWVGTFAGKLNVFNRQKNNFDHPDYPMLSEYTSVIYQDRQKNIWFGRDKGIDVIENATGKVRHYFNQPANHNSLVANDVNSILQDKAGLIWIGTKEGISILNVNTGKFINIEEKQGLPSNNVWNILEDNNGRVWTSSANGIAAIKLTVKSGAYNYEIHKYSDVDGLQGREFNANAALKTKNGDMLFGGPHGFNRFNPNNINSFSLKPQLLFTDFQLFNKSVNVGDTVNGSLILKRSITQTTSLVLHHNENVFSIEFAACDYFNPNKILYQYMLEGFDKSWLTAPNNTRRATYTNLDAGDYTFRVRAQNINNPGKVSEQTLKITILPPFWKSPLAYLLYLIVIAGILLYIRHRGIVNLKRQFRATQDKLDANRKLAAERGEAQRMHELDLMKIKFFTNVSHEFRTPLSLIASPIDTLIKHSDTPEQKTQLLMIKRNSRRLLNLVNQLLDFRKMETRELKLNPTRGDIIGFIKEVCSSFIDLANQSHIGYLFDSEVDLLITRFDHDKIERVLFNLLSNAFKFTPSGGHISVLLRLVQCNDHEAGKQSLEIKVMDTGIGISKEKQDKIFERFFQDDLPEGMLNQGSGIGLSITHEFVKMHSGDIQVESETGNGSCFIIHLPLNIEEQLQAPANAPIKPAAAARPVAHEPEAVKKPVILLIEDNDDMRFYLKDNLKYIFNIIEAVNGREGWQKALALHPNLIVSDVSMPEMNGIDLCSKIRNDSRTSHIPVILLTALAEEEDQLLGLANGANDYIAKPFNFEILLSKINGLLNMQQVLKKTYQKQMEIQVTNVEIVSEDEKFLKAAFDCIEKNITNHNFSVEELSRQMALSRVSLYKRLLALTGKTPVDCIRTVRLKRAVQLLEKSQLSIANIAYEVGFNNPTYFSKVFKDEYGTVPSEYLIAYRKREKELSETD